MDALPRNKLHGLRAGVNMDLFDRMRKLDMSLCPEPDGEWSVLDSVNKRAWFGSTPEEAISNAEQGVQVDGKAAT